MTITEGNAAPQILDASLSTPLSRDEEQMRKWIYDEKKWQDVFSTKPYEYLSLISQMKIPWYDRERGKWVDKEEIDAQRQGHASQVNEANAGIERAMANAGIAQAPVVEEKRDFTSSLIMKDEDIPF